MKTLQIGLSSAGIVNDSVTYQRKNRRNTEEVIVFISGVIEKSSFSEVKQIIAKGQNLTIYDTELGYLHLNTSNCYLEKKEDLIGVDGVTTFRIINSQLGDNYQDKILIIGNENDLSDDEGKEFFYRTLNNKIQNNTPFPFKEEWIPYFFNELKDLNLIDSLEISSKNIKIGVGITLPNDNNMESLISFSHNCFRWKTTHKRVPQIKEIVYGILNVEDFNFKKWQSFLKDFGGIDHFKKIDSNTKRGIVSVFELFGEHTIDIIDEFGSEIWWQINLNPIKILQKKMGFKIVTDKCVKLINTLKTTTEENKEEYKFSLIEHLDVFIEGDWNFTKIKEKLNSMVYKNVEYSDVARVCARAKVTQDEFEIYQEWWKLNRSKREKSARTIPTISGSIEGTDISWEMCDSMDVNILVVGNETNCCQHPTSLGGACVDYMLKHPESSTIFRVTEKGKTIAQSFTWLESDITGKGSSLVFDNIEVKQSGGKIRDAVIKSYKEYVKTISKIAKTFKINAAVVGGGYSDVNLDKFTQKIPNSHKHYASIPNSLGYSDAHNQYLLADFH